jgi:hypothetical protein
MNICFSTISQTLLSSYSSNVQTDSNLFAHIFWGLFNDVKKVLRKFFWNKNFLNHFLRIEINVHLEILSKYHKIYLLRKFKGKNSLQWFIRKHNNCQTRDVFDCGSSPCNCFYTPPPHSGHFSIFLCKSLFNFQKMSNFVLALELSILGNGIGIIKYMFL